MNRSAADNVNTLTVRDVHARDFEEWSRLYRGYRDFYEQPHNDAVFERVWEWLMNPAHEVRGLVAELDGALVGLGHYRSFARPLSGSHGVFLDDLFTDPAVRGSGAGTAILARLRDIAAAEGATVVRWITAQDNAVARSLYDREASLTKWATYDMPPSH